MKGKRLPGWYCDQTAPQPAITGWSLSGCGPARRAARVFLHSSSLPGPMNKFSQRVELVANITIIVVAVLLVGVVADRYFLRPAAHGRPARLQPVIGSKLNVSGMNWSSHPKTLILVLQRGCRFCSESVPFYKRIVASVKDENIRVIAAFPTEVQESTAHLEELGLASVEVRQLSLDSLQTSGTPTLILTDDQGRITAYWLGKLPPDKEAEVLNKLHS